MLQGFRIHFPGSPHIKFLKKDKSYFFDVFTIYLLKKKSDNVTC